MNAVGVVASITWTGPGLNVFTEVVLTTSTTISFAVALSESDPGVVTSYKRNLIRFLARAQIAGLLVSFDYTPGQNYINTVEANRPPPPAGFVKQPNVQVTHVTNLDNAHSESTVSASMIDSAHLLGASKRFYDRKNYGFSLSAFASTDAGQSWTETVLPLQAGWSCIADPAVAWDAAGNAYVIGLPTVSSTGPDLAGPAVGIAVFRSTDGGASWDQGTVIHASPNDDKPGAVADGSDPSPWFGRVYCAWDDDIPHGTRLRFARTTDSGATWKGVGQLPPGFGFETASGFPVDINDSFSPCLTVVSDGTLFIFWRNYMYDARVLTPPDTNKIKYVKSSDGGETFSGPFVAVDGLVPLTTKDEPQGDSQVGFPEFTKDGFRVLTIPSAAASGNNIVIAWADMREGTCRIYFRHSGNGGQSWDGPSAGAPMFAGRLFAYPDGAVQCFHPQVAADGHLLQTNPPTFACAFYQYGYKYDPSRNVFGTQPMIELGYAISSDGGNSFVSRTIASDAQWDPALDSPYADADPHTGFIGEYFGLACQTGTYFTAFWTSTSTGYQDILSTNVQFQRPVS